jgi:hypothetical protein
MKRLKVICAILLANIFLFTLFSCSKKNYSIKPNYQFKSMDGSPDFSDLHYWAAHPWKWDPSDSVSKKYKQSFKKDSLADVFFLYPTTLLDEKDGRWNAPIDDPLINANTDYTTILYQLSAFNEKCRVFSPRYRQAHIKAFFSTDTINAIRAFDTAYADIKKSFEYYLYNLNKGQPIIIASHSQGTKHAARLLSEFFDGKSLQKKLVCAYILGMPTPENYFKKIPTCKDSSSTGCFVGWRTYKDGYIDSVYVAKEKIKSLVTNPLTWNCDGTYANKNFNTGSILKNFNKVKTGVVDARVHQNVLWTCKPKFFGNIFLTSKNYHVGDINLFYDNIRRNVNTRIREYLKQ